MSDPEGRPEPPDPPGESREGWSWSDATEGERFSPEEPETWPTGRSRMPDASEWVGIAAVVLVVLLALWGGFWLLEQILF